MYLVSTEMIKCFTYNVPNNCVIWILNIPQLEKFWMYPLIVLEQYSIFECKIVKSWKVQYWTITEQVYFKNIIGIMGMKLNKVIKAVSVV